ncbi:MAG TPA: hypothetical protein PKM11_06705 [Methanomassiliicoccales archaeon]|nr:hypothetical protein [Methanomassiliicoccales archaeon]
MVLVKVVERWSDHQVRTEHVLGPDQFLQYLLKILMEVTNLEIKYLAMIIIQPPVLNHGQELGPQSAPRHAKGKRALGGGKNHPA